MTDKEKETRTKWHNIKANEVLKELDSSKEEGLTAEEVKKRLETYGENKLPERKEKHPLLKFLTHFHNVLIYVLLVAAVITGVMEYWVDTIVILAVVLINALVGYIQEGKAEKALEDIKKMLSLEAQVLRNGDKKTVNAEELVPGDIVLLRSGDKVPADLRLVEVKDLRVEESALTGESTDVDKITDPVNEDAVVGDRKSMAFSGTMVTYGAAAGVVVETGATTELGKINQMISEVEEFTTPLLQKMNRFSLQLSVVIIVFSAAFFAFGYFFRDYTLIDLFRATIAVIVASIPEGLPAIITITLAVGVQRMASRNSIIRRLPAVETLGAVSVICSDKTGTLTRNEMMVQTIRTADGEFGVEGSGYKPEGDIKKDDEKVEDISSDGVLEKLIQSLYACNDAKLEEKDGDWELIGSPTEGALVTLGMKAGLKDFKPERIADIPFESEHKYMATLNEVDGNRFIYLKGAPEKLLEVCKKQATADGEKDIDADFWKEQMEEIAGRGQRLMAAAYRKESGNTDEIDHDDVEKDMIFLGVVGIIDPPREEVYDAIKICKKAGIRVIMITGDHAITAEAIAKELGITEGGGTITGEELEKVEDDEMTDVVMKYNVFARTSPEHKLRLVKALQENNKLSAMTGDGVNDAPALKRANIGVAMGIKGTEVSKDSSEMVLADDNFASIVNAVEEGRTAYDNIRKTILFILPTNGVQALVLVAAIVLGVTMPVTPVQALWINMVTAVTLALALAFEPMEQRIMELSPREPDEPILGGYFLWRIAMVSVLIGGLTFFVYRMFYTGEAEIEKVRAIAVNTIATGQVVYLLNCRKFYQSVFTRDFFNNKYVFIAIGALVFLQAMFTYAPFMNDLFETAPVSAAEWPYILAVGLVVLLVVELEKWISRTWFFSE